MTDILAVAERFAPEVVWMELRDVTAERDRLREALDIASQYVTDAAESGADGAEKDAQRIAELAYGPGGNDGR